MKKILFTIVALVALLIGFNADAKKVADKAIQKELLSIMETNDVSAMSVALVKGNEIIYSTALGLKNRETGEKVKIDDIYRIASVSKSFTGVAVMQLVEQGKLSLEDDVKDILGFNIRNPKYPDTPITVRQLLCHCSSIIDAKVNYGTFKGLDTDNPDQTTEKIYASWAPGTKYQYSNRGTNLLGCVVEKVSGERFDLYVVNHILRPLGIENAGHNVDNLDKNTFVTLYTVKDGEFKEAKKAYSRKAEKLVEKGTYVMGVDAFGFSPCGGIKISVEGLAKWMMMFKAHGVGQNGARILSEESVKEMFTKQTPKNSKNKYGFCVSANGKMVGGRLTHGHNGSANGLKSCMYFSPEEDWGIVAMCSSHGKTEKMAYSQVAEYLASIFIDK